MSSARRYRFGELLGEGGFGVVYKAAMLGADGFEKPVAIKLLRLSGGDGRLAEEAQQRFRDEARLLGLLRHRAIVQVDGLVRINGHQAVVMEYLEGVSLRALVKRAPVPERPALEIVAEVAAALEAAWHRPGPAGKPLNVCHRDLKPANLQLSTDGELKVLDFGIARADFQSREAETRSLAMGSVEYMSPKRLDFDDDGSAGDVYSLGCVLYEMLVGEAFGRTSANPKSHAARFEANIGKAPESCREMIAKMLAFDPTERPGAREIEKRCLELARTQPLSLRDWAADAVPACVSTATPATGSWTGKLLAEDGDVVVPPPPPEARPRFVVGGGTGVMPTVQADRAEVARALAVADVPPPAASGTVGAGSGPLAKTPGSGPISAAVRSGPITGSVGGRTGTVSRRTGPVTGARKEGAGTAAKAGAAAMGVLGIGSIAAGCIGLVVVVVMVVRGFRGDEVAGPTPDAAVAEVAAPQIPPSVAAPPVPAEAVPAPVAAPVLVPTPAPVQTVVVAPVAPPKADPPRAKPASKPAAPPALDPGTSATIELSGNAEAVHFRAGDTNFALPLVPAGVYTVLATFDGKEVDAGQVTVGQGEKVTLKCKKAFLRCTR